MLTVNYLRSFRSIVLGLNLFFLPFLSQQNAFAKLDDADFVNEQGNPIGSYEVLKRHQKKKRLTGAGLIGGGGLVLLGGLYATVQTAGAAFPLPFIGLGASAVGIKFVRDYDLALRTIEAAIDFHQYMGESQDVGFDINNPSNTLGNLGELNLPNEKVLKSVYIIQELSYKVNNIRRDFKLEEIKPMRVVHFLAYLNAKSMLHHNKNFKKIKYVKAVSPHRLIAHLAVCGTEDGDYIYREDLVEQAKAVAKERFQETWRKKLSQAKNKAKTLQKKVKGKKGGIKPNHVDYDIPHSSEKSQNDKKVKSSNEYGFEDYDPASDNVWGV